MSTPEYGRPVPSLSQEALKNLAIEAEKWLKDPKLTADKDLTRRIWKAINAFPAYKKGGYDRDAIFEDVRKTIWKQSKKPEIPYDSLDTASLMGDAIAREKQMPPSTFDIDAEEYERKPLPPNG